MVNVIEMPNLTPTAAGPSDLAQAESVAADAVIDIRNFSFAYGHHQVLHDINLQIPARAVTAFIGPSGCGKTTLLRCLNRMNDLIDSSRIVQGSILIESRDINHSSVDVVELRRRIG